MTQPSDIITMVIEKVPILKENEYLRNLVTKAFSGIIERFQGKTEQFSELEKELDTKIGLCIQKIQSGAPMETEELTQCILNLVLYEKIKDRQSAENNQKNIVLWKLVSIGVGLISTCVSVLVTRFLAIGGNA